MGLNVSKLEALFWFGGFVFGCVGSYLVSEFDGDKEALLKQVATLEAKVSEQSKIIKLEQARLTVCMRQIDPAESNFADMVEMDGHISRIDFIMEIDGKSRWFVMDVPVRGGKQ